MRKVRSYGEHRAVSVYAEHGDVTRGGGRPEAHKYNRMLAATEPLHELEVRCARRNDIALYTNRQLLIGLVMARVFVLVY